MTNSIIKYLTLAAFLLTSWVLIVWVLACLGLSGVTIIPLGMAYGFAVGWNWERITDWVAERFARGETK